MKEQPGKARDSCLGHANTTFTHMVGRAKVPYNHHMYYLCRASLYASRIAWIEAALEIITTLEHMHVRCHCLNFPMVRTPEVTAQLFDV